MRARADGGDLPALALTAFARPQDRQRALESGFQRYLVKPLDPNELLLTVAQLASAESLKNRQD